MVWDAEERKKRCPVMSYLEDEDYRQIEQYGVLFNWFPDASRKALEREDEVKAIFHRAKHDFERTTLASLAKGEKHVMEDLFPQTSISRRTHGKRFACGWRGITVDGRPNVAWLLRMK